MSFVPVSPKQLGADERSGPEEIHKVIIVYVCPKCDSYYASSSVVHLEDQEVRAPSHASDAGTVRHMRDKCPTPNCGGKRQRRYARLIPISEVTDAHRAAEAAAKAREKKSS